ncbi:MAG TPA: hypothetical protein VF011_13230 [Terriglobales bacterium]
MKILLLHPEDHAARGKWADTRWDLIVDLGYAGPTLYAEWSRELATRVISLRQFTAGDESHRWIGRVLAQGRGRMLDRMGLDWWELLAVWRYQDLEALYLARQLSGEIYAAQVELFATRPHRFASLFAHVLSRPIQYFQTGAGPGRFGRIAVSLRQFRARQIAEIAFDKWDSTYQFRRHLVKRRANVTEPVVLLPSAYSNVTRTVLSYAAALPRCRFLLATTRSNAMPASLPENVEAVSLAAYADSDQQTRREFAELKRAWHEFQRTRLAESEDLRIARDAGTFDYFSEQLRIGLCIRDAWHALLQHEPITGVLCGDDLNHYTRLPLALAARMNLNAVYCAHGALDSGLLFKQSYANIHLVKGEMEKDYALRSGAVATRQVVVAAPPLADEALQTQTSMVGDKIVLFSQPYELQGGRTIEIYRELMPRLCSVARAVGKRLVIKLHPFESARARARLLAAALPQKGDRDWVEILSGAQPALLDQAWCGIGIDSSVAVECTLKGIPFFLCQWLDFGGAGYMQQFACYGAGILLQSPDDLQRIPEQVSGYRLDHGINARLWHNAAPGQLEAIITGAGPSRAAAKFAS